MFWGFQIVNTFWDMENCGYFFGFITKLDYNNGSFLCILGSFLKVKVRKGGIFGVAKTSFSVRLKFLIFFGVNCRC